MGIGITVMLYVPICVCVGSHCQHAYYVCGKAKYREHAHVRNTHTTPTDDFRELELVFDLDYPLTTFVVCKVPIHPSILSTVVCNWFVIIAVRIHVWVCRQAAAVAVDRPCRRYRNCKHANHIGYTCMHKRTRARVRQRT
jgi:hypothetical protein